MNMKKFNVYVIHSFSKFVGTFEAKDKDDAEELAYESDNYQSIGGLCHQCSRNIGDGGDSEFYSEEID